MKICDVCLSPGTLLSVSGSGGGKYVWPTAEERPDFCNECLDLLKQKAWVALGERHGQALHRFLERTDE